MLLHRTRIYPIPEFHGQCKHVDVGWQLGQFEVVVEELVHQVAKFDVVLVDGWALIIGTLAGSFGGV